jgi:hypothetical protein
MADGAKPARLTIDGVEQMYYSEVEDEADSGDTALKSIPLGMFGHSDGAGMHKVNGTSLVPDTGREFDFVERADTHRTTNLGIRMGAKSREYRGRFLTAKEQSKVGDAVSIAWSFEGRRVR